MALVNRKDYLNQLKSVLIGISTKSPVEYSDCFIFSKGMVSTYNYEVACSADTEIDIEGTVPAEPLLNLLERLDGEEVDVFVENGELRVKSGEKLAGIRLAGQYTLPFDLVERPKNFVPISDEMKDAILVTVECCSRSEAHPLLRCIHMTPTYLEASDDFRIVRYSIQTGLSQSVLAKGQSVEYALKVGVNEMAVTENWLHFRNPNSVYISCRRMLDQYPETSKFFEIRGKPLTLPKDLDKAVERALVFWSETHKEAVVTVELSDGKMVVECSGQYGWYREPRPSSYQGPHFRFYCAARVLGELSKRITECEIASQLLRMESGPILYVSRIAASQDASNGLEV